MPQLNYSVLEKSGYKGYVLQQNNAPEKVMQFGEGNFLRAFVDYFIDVANEKSGFNGKVVISTDAMLDMCRRIIDENGCVKKLRELDLETYDDKIELNVEVDLTLGTQSALSIAKNLQKALHGGLSYITGMDIRKVNIRVNEIFL